MPVHHGLREFSGLPGKPKGTVILSNHQDNEGEALPANIGENCTRGKITHLNFENKTHLYFSQWLNDKSFFLAVMMPEELFVRSFMTLCGIISFSPLAYPW